MLQHPSNLLQIPSIIHSRATQPEHTIRITGGDFAQTHKISERSTAYTALKEAADRLYERDIKTYDERGRRYGRFRWVQSVEYPQGQGYVELVFTQHVAPYITLLHQQFTTYFLKQISRVNSIYAIRLFELLIKRDVRRADTQPSPIAPATVALVPRSATGK